MFHVWETLACFAKKRYNKKNSFRAPCPENGALRAAFTMCGDFFAVRFQNAVRDKQKTKAEN